MFAQGNNIHVVWSGGFADPYIRYKRSIDGGKHWDEDKTLTNDPTQPRIAVDGNNVYVVWFRWKNTQSGNDEIFYKKSMDNGENWSEDIRFARSYHGHQARIPDVAASDGNVYVVWQDGRDDNIEIYYKISMDSGVTWSNDTRLTYDLDDSYDSSIAMYEENAYVVWVDYNFTEDWTYVYFKRTVPYPGFLTENLSLPIVSVLSPKRWDTVDGVVEIRGTAESTNPNTTIQKVEIKIDPDGEWEIVSGTTNWSYTWDTTNVSDGKHTLFVRAYDGGSYSEYYVLPLYVRTKEGGLIPEEMLPLIVGIASIMLLLAVGLILLYKRKHKV
ncbi:MAG: Ig-like domain-containing protein [Thermoplasmatales archaeon]|nr:Ig-like domain-containing protein [Thermoplasmatales archaeon]